MLETRKFQSYLYFCQLPKTLRNLIANKCFNCIIYFSLHSLHVWTIKRKRFIASTRWKPDLYWCIAAYLFHETTLFTGIQTNSESVDDSMRHSYDYSYLALISYLYTTCLTMTILNIYACTEWLFLTFMHSVWWVWIQTPDTQAGCAQMTNINLEGQHGSLVFFEIYYAIITFAIWSHICWLVT